MRSTGSSILFYLTAFNLIGWNLIETMSMDMYMEISRGMPGAILLLL